MLGLLRKWTPDVEADLSPDSHDFAARVQEIGDQVAAVMFRNANH